ncbi:hypothetical protein HPB49_005929 [Dermacentor silvarum]|uniref:Uncharacterized protein n=1 Tax=Dermacentor silvarum TaxID=543639 RepID=A0ACB8DW76_DERSI|nr:hypothetical protein HPB49_005929 [Dermacentor silvarum]
MNDGTTRLLHKLIGELTVLSSVGPGPLFGYLRADTQDSCYGVVTVRSTDFEAELQKRLYWPEGEILHIRRLGTTNKVRLTFSGKVKPRYVTYDALLILVHPYKKTIPACSQWGSVGHRPDACPGPKPDLCGTCGNTVPLMDGARAPHECTPKCAICAGPHVNADRSCKERYRAPPPKSPTPPLESQPGPTKGKCQRPLKPRPPDTRASQQMTPSPAIKSPPPPHPGAGTPGPSKRGLTPPGPPTERSPTRQGPPASSTSHLPPPGLQPAAQGELTWAARIRQGPQVSGTRTAASPPPLPEPPTPSQEQIEIQQLKARVLVASLTQAMEALVNRSPPLPTSTPSGPAPEAMDSAPSEQRDCTALLAPIEAHLSNLEGQMASIVTTIEDRLAAAIQTVFDRIPAMIVAQLPQIISSTRRPTTKLKRVNKSQMQRPLPHMAEADRQPVTPERVAERLWTPLLYWKPPKILIPKMAGHGLKSRRTRANSDPLTIVQWNCRGFRARTKRAALRLHLETYPDLPAVVTLQEPGEHAALTNYTAKLPDWTKFQLEYTNSIAIPHQGYATWSQHLVSSLRHTEQTTQTQKHLQRALHAYAGDAEKLAQALREKYLSGRQQDPLGPAYSYAGTENADLDRCFQLHDLKAALSCYWYLMFATIAASRPLSSSTTRRRIHDGLRRE